MGSNILSGDKLNFTRMGIASVDEIKVVLADILRCEIKPQDLQKAVKSCSELMTGRHKLRTEQLKICCLCPPAIPDYNKFDVSLLYTLIRNTCPKLKPTQDWGKPPSITDLQIGDDIERLREFRNEMFAHLDSSKVEDVVFNSQWQNLEQIFKRIQTFLKKKGFTVDYGKKLASIANSDFGLKDMEKYRLLLEGMMRLLREKKDYDVPVITVLGNDEILCGKKTCFEAKLDKCLSSNNWPITWEKIQGNITEQLDTSKEKYTGSSSRCLVIPRVLKEDEGEYRAVISRENNGTHMKIPSNSISLTVKGDKPTLAVTKDLEVPFGTTAVIQADIQAWPLPESVLWQKSKHMDPKSGEFETIDLTSIRYSGSTREPAKPKLVINHTTFEDRLFYRLVVANSVGTSISNSTFLNITGSSPSLFMSHDTDFQEESVTLNCRVLCENSHQLIGIIWTKDDKEIDIHRSRGKYSGGDINNPSLRIRKVHSNDAGMYQCRAYNAVGSTCSKLINLGQPDITLSAEENSEKGVLAVSVSIQCIPDANKVEWKVQRYPNDEFRTINIHEEMYKGSTVSLPDPVLILNRFNSQKPYLYKVEARNFIGLSSITDVVDKCQNKTEEKAEQCVKDDRSVSSANMEDNKVNRLASIFRKKGSSIRFNDLRLHLIREIPERKLKSLKESLEVISSMELSIENVTTVEDVFTFLLKEGIFEERNVIMMQYLLRRIGCPDLEQDCVEYAKKDKKALCYFEEKVLPGDGKKRVQLHVDDDIEQFTDLDSLIATVAAIVGCDQSCIDVVGLHPESSFIITISMKEEFARTLRQNGPHRLTGLLKYNVDWIKVENEIIYIAEGSKRELGDREKMEGHLEKIDSFEEKLRGSITDSGGFEMHLQEKETIESRFKERPKEILTGSGTGYGEYEMEFGKKEKMENQLKKRENLEGKLIGRKREIEVTEDLRNLDEKLSNMSLSQYINSTAVNTSSITVSELDSIHHISVVTSDRLWVSDYECLLQVDSSGHKIEKKRIETDMLSDGGFHTVTDDGELLFINHDHGVQKMTSDVTITTLIKSEREILRGEFLCIHSSRINGDILLGYRDGVRRYDRKGKLIGDVMKHWRLFIHDQMYITENKNGDIWVSAFHEEAVVVMDKSGRHRFIYRGQESHFDYRDQMYHCSFDYRLQRYHSGFCYRHQMYHSGSDYRRRMYHSGSYYRHRKQPCDFGPLGLCADILGQVLVCDYYNASVDLLDQDGQFLCLLLTRDDGLRSPTALCVDDKHNLYLGQRNSNTIKVYRYLKETGDKNTSSELDVSKTKAVFKYLQETEKKNTSLMESK